MRSYIESTIPSYVVARPARDLLQAARQQLTRDWWDLQREQHELFTSQVVLDEIAFGEKAMAQLRLETLQAVPLLQVTDEVKELARKVLTSGLLPVTSDRDCHLAKCAPRALEDFAGCLRYPSGLTAASPTHELLRSLPFQNIR